MQTYRRSLAPQETDHELLWLAISLGSFLILAVWFAAQWPTPQCAFHRLTSLPCVTCGATRSAWQFLHGHFATAFLYNPLAFLTLCGLVGFDLYAATILVLRAPRWRLRNFSRSEIFVARILASALLAANWLYLLIARPF